MQLTKVCCGLYEYTNGMSVKKVHGLPWRLLSTNNEILKETKTLSEMIKFVERRWAK